MNRKFFSKSFSFADVVLYTVCLVFIAVTLSSCAIFGGVKMVQPKVAFTGAKLDKLSFSNADLLFDMQIENPNPLGVKLASFDYELLVNGFSFLSGKQDKNLDIPASGKDTIQLPLTVRFLDLYQAVQSLRNQDESAYDLKCSFGFNLPIIGEVKVPVQTSGKVPLLKLPSIDVATLKVTRLDVFGAELKLAIDVKNNNPFAVALDGFKYQFDVNGQSWAVGQAKSVGDVTQKGESQIEIPIALNFLKVGQTAYQLLRGDKKLNYQLQGNLDINAAHPLLGKVSIPFDKLGAIDIVK